MNRGNRSNLLHVEFGIILCQDYNKIFIIKYKNVQWLTVAYPDSTNIVYTVFILDQKL